MVPAVYRHRIRKLVSTAKVVSDTVLAARVKLRRDLTSWRSCQFERFPTLQHLISSIDPLKPEAEGLLLPSSFNEETRVRLGLQKLATIEYTLREGQAHDALEGVRLSIKTFNFNLAFKVNFVHGQGPNTRAQAFLGTLAADKVSAADKYRRAWSALVALGLPETDRTLQPLHDTELWSKNTSGPSKMGDSKKEDPWFWTAGRPSGLSTKEEADRNVESESLGCGCRLKPDQRAVDRVKWFRDRAARDRSREEKEVLEEEFRRTQVSFNNMTAVWTELVSCSQRAPGSAAYAYKQAAMYRGLARGCEEWHEKALKKAAEKTASVDTEALDGMTAQISELMLNSESGIVADY